MPACSTEEFCLQICCQKRISDQVFYITITDADIGSIKSLHILVVKPLNHILVNFEQNRMVRPAQNFELFDQKWLNIFDKGLTSFWMTFL